MFTLQNRIDILFYLQLAVRIAYYLVEQVKFVEQVYIITEENYEHSFIVTK